MRRLAADYGHQRVTAKLEELRAQFGRPLPRPESLDEFAACGIRRPEVVRDFFVPHFYFGCEADDPMNARAFNAKANRSGVRLRAVFGSDIGHWDVTDVGQVVTEAYEQVERGLLTEEDFRDFTFANPVRLHAGMTPDFFRGTPVESAAVRLLESGDASPAS